MCVCVCINIHITFEQQMYLSLKTLTNSEIIRVMVFQIIRYSA